jgi:hypothetical protein
MPTAPPAAPDPGAVDSKQAAFNALKGVLNSAQAAMNNPANTQAARDTAHALWSTTNDQLDALDLEVFTGDTAALQAAASDMKTGMKQLKDLQAQIAALGNGIKEAASIISGIDSAIAELGKLA